MVDFISVKGWKAIYFLVSVWSLLYGNEEATDAFWSLVNKILIEKELRLCLFALGVK